MSMKLINSIHNCQVLFRKNNLPLEDLTGRQHTFIFSICENPGRTQDSIVQELHLDKSTVARALNKLEQNGYVERKSNPNDNRELFVFPTEKALGIFIDVKPINAPIKRQTNIGFKSGFNFLRKDCFPASSVFGINKVGTPHT